PKTTSDQKIKKSGDNLSLELERTQDILKTLGEMKQSSGKKTVLCGFSMETENLIANSRAKLEKKNLDMIVANSLRVQGAGFGGDTNVVTIITRDGEKELPLMSKEEVAVEILNELKAES
ncbi:MAG: phosphopantothenoylcysteine decarboxylase, partial [Treponema sp.]|nr:phosphopantothenoylcysteine decarboxylase [Treponema sp.]